MNLEFSCYNWFLLVVMEKMNILVFGYLLVCVFPFEGLVFVFVKKVGGLSKTASLPAG